MAKKRRKKNVQKRIGHTLIHCMKIVFSYFSSNPPGFAFILYKYGEDADAAVRSKFPFKFQQISR